MFSLLIGSRHQMYNYMLCLCSCSIHQMYISRCLSWPVALETRCTFFCFFCSVSFLETCSKCMCLNCSELLDTDVRSHQRGNQKPQVKSETVNRRKPDTTMTKRKGTKVQTKNYKTLRRKLKIEQRESH